MRTSADIRQAGAACGVALLALLILSGWPGAASGSQLGWADSDWSQGHYSYIWHLDADSQPGVLVLENDLSDWRYLASPTVYQGLYCMEVYHDSLFLAASDYPFMFDGAAVLTYDYGVGDFEVAYEPYESGLNVIKQFGDSLYIPGPDAMDPWTDNGSIYVYGGHEWVEKETVPYAVHVCDVEICNGILYVSTGHYAGGMLGYGCVWISYDYGDTFTRVLTLYPTELHPARRFFGLGHFGDRVFAQPDGFPPVEEQIYTTTNGVEWDTLTVPGLQPDTQATFIEWNNRLHMMAENRMFIWNGTTFTRYTLPFHGYRWCRGYRGYKGHLYGGGDDCVLYRWLYGGQWEAVGDVALDPSTEDIESIVDYYGRMFISTSRVSNLDEARLYVSAADPIGRLASVAHDFGVGVQCGLLSWDDYRPGEGTTRFQIRSGDSIEELEQNYFLGPDGTTSSYYVEPRTPLPGLHNGHRYFQYQVDLICPDGLNMPFLDRVVLEADSANAAGVGPVAGDPRDRDERLLLEQAGPNPARAAVELRLHLEGATAEAPLRVAVLDPQGRVLRTEQLASAGCGPVLWRWDLRDDRGRRVPGGVYQARFEIAGLRGLTATRPVVVLP